MKHFQTSENENAERKLLSYLLNLYFNYSKMILKDIKDNKKIMKILNYQRFLNSEKL